MTLENYLLETLFPLKYACCSFFMGIGLQLTHGL